MKKNRTLRVSALLLALTLITTCFVGGTFAKYTSSANAQDTVTVAKWSIKLNDTEMTTSAVTFNLFDEIKDSNINEPESDVKSGLIAPGTSGKIALKVDNKSEVNAKFSIALEQVANSNNIPLQYSTDGTNWSDSIATLNVTDQEIAMETGTSTLTVYWRWAFDNSTPSAPATQTDATDTALGTTAQATAPVVTIKATLTATQVD